MDAKINIFEKVFYYFDSLLDSNIVRYILFDFIPVVLIWGMICFILFKIDKIEQHLGLKNKKKSNIKEEL